MTNDMVLFQVVYNKAINKLYYILINKTAPRCNCTKVENYGHIKDCAHSGSSGKKVKAQDKIATLQNFLVDARHIK